MKTQWQDTVPTVPSNNHSGYAYFWMYSDYYNDVQIAQVVRSFWEDGTRHHITVLNDPSYGPVEVDEAGKYPHFKGARFAPLFAPPIKYTLKANGYRAVSVKASSLEAARMEASSRLDEKASEKGYEPPVGWTTALVKKGA